MSARNDGDDLDRPAATIDELSARIDASRFVGRTAELEQVEAARQGRVPTRVLYLHGPGGVGKSALLREVARRVAAAGQRCVQLDGRTIERTAAGLAAALAPAAGDPCVVLIDEVDHLASLRFELTGLLAGTLSASSVAVLAGRTPPERDWADGALGHVAASRSVRPLSPGEARELLRRGGPIGDEEAEELVRWSGGFPLPLTVALASRASAADPSGPAERGTGRTDVEAAVLERLGGRELDDIDPDVVDVAAVAPTVDARLLAAVMPGRATRAALAQLRGSSLTELVGGRVMLHPLLRSAARTRLRQTDPDRYRSLVLAVADHIHDRVVGDGSWHAIDMADLVEDEGVRQGFGPSGTHHADRIRPEDQAALAARLGGAGTRWRDRFGRWCEEVPHATVLVRRADGTPVGQGIAAPARAMPRWAADEIDQGPMLRHAAAAGRTDATLFIHDIKVVEDSPSAQVEAVRVGNLGLARLTGMRNPRWLYVTVPSEDMAAFEPFGYQPVPELARHDGERDLVTLVNDHGPGGFVGGMREIVRAEQGAAPAEPDGGRGHALVEALRAFRDDDALARSPLADGDGPAAVASVRAQVSAALDTAFGDSAVDRELVTALRRAYIDPDGGHAAARRELHMSRSTFYRHLQRGRDRLARHGD